MKSKVNFYKIIKTDSIKKEDIIVFKFSDDDITDLARETVVKELRKRIPAETLVLFIKDNMDLSILDEKEMGKLGWYRK